MKITSLDFIQSFLFDTDYKEEVTEYIYAHNHKSGLRQKWVGKLESVPSVLFNNDENDKTFWVIIRNEGDLELRTALSLDPEDPDAAFEKMPVGTQRAVAIFFPKDKSPLGWRLYQNFIDESSDFVRGGIKTFTKERKRFHGKRPYEFQQDLKVEAKAE